MNRTYKSLWSAATNTFVAVSENTRSAGKSTVSVTVASTTGKGMRAVLHTLTAAVVLAYSLPALALPLAGVVAAGSASIGTVGSSTTIVQSTPHAVINWQSFQVAPSESVQFVQPNAASVTLNRVLGADPSHILGRLSANGNVFLVNPNGILFGKNASVAVGGLVAATLNISDPDFMAGRYQWSGASGGAVLNQGSINANEGYVALLGARVGNDGVIVAPSGAVTLAAGSAMVLDVAGDGLLQVRVNQGAVNALAENGGLIQVQGGRVLMTARAADSLLHSAVNNTGVIQAQTLVTGAHGSIMLMGDMQGGLVQLSGTLDASAPHGGDGGFIETSAGQVLIANDAKVSTEAPTGRTGHWLIDPQDFTIGSGATDNISGATLSALLVTNSVTIRTATGPDAIVAGTPPLTSLGTATVGNGDIHVNQAVSWTATPSTTTLTLLAERDVNLNAAVTAVNGNVVLCCGRDANIKAAVTTTNGSLLVGAARDINLGATAAVTVTDGNITLGAGNNLNVNAKITLTRGSSIPAQSLGLATGLVLSGGNSASGPGIGGGTVVFAAGAPPTLSQGLTHP